uniref:Ovule protein n=1 Tax=Caenorhabditis tropicalis TaxID=1561998 RepID=A0A1I7U7X4_9PELO
MNRKESKFENRRFKPILTTTEQPISTKTVPVKSHVWNGITHQHISLFPVSTVLSSYNFSSKNYSSEACADMQRITSLRLNVIHAPIIDQKTRKTDISIRI